MVVLKKLKGSTLMETLVATVLIIVIFSISSMILNNLFSNVMANRTHTIEAHLNELHYLYINNSLQVPYDEEFEHWQITIEPFTEKGNNFISFDAINSTNKKEFNRTFYAEN